MASPRLQQQQIVSASHVRPLLAGILVIIPQLSVAIGLGWWTTFKSAILMDRQLFCSDDKITWEAFSSILFGQLSRKNPLLLILSTPRDQVHR